MDYRVYTLGQDGRFVSGAQPFSTFQALIDEELGKG